MKTTGLILALCLTTISGCQKEQPKKYVALKDVPVYKEPIDGSENVTFIVKKDAVCDFGDEVMNKVYLFKKVSCKEEQG